MSESRTVAPIGTEDFETVLRLATRALRALGEVGHPDRASRIAARGWSELRHGSPEAAQRLNGTLHYLARLHGHEQKEYDMAADDIQLDVRSEIPARRHELIFETYHGLADGTAFVLVNDHDPKPLYYQFEAEHPGQFTWEYLEEGPVDWRVRIGRVAASS